MRALVIHSAGDLRVETRDGETVGPGQVAVRLAVGGICGSDLHYFRHGGFGAVRLKEPMILGHEVSGFVCEVGPGVDTLSVGDLVAVSPSRPCRLCQFCQRGLQNHCENMRFYGSAMPFPHIQGAFRETLVADADQCVKADGLTPAEAAMAEPLAVCLHATRRAGEVLGKRVLVTGAGPIGMLAILAARAAGAVEVVATDLSDAPLARAREIGASQTVNVGTHPEGLARFQAGKGVFDILYECTGSASALASGLAALRPRSVAVQLGLGGDMSVPVQLLTAKEIELRGSFRFHEEFATAVATMQSRQIDVRPLITHTFPLERAREAFETAADREQAMKAQIRFAAA